MRKQVVMIALSIASLIATQAQEYKIKRANGKLKIDLPSVTIEGYNGNEIIFTSQSKKAEVDPKAEGLETINNSGYRDNSGLGISVVEKGNTIEVNEVTENQDIKILVPKGVIIAWYWNKVTAGAKAIFRNLENEIEIDSYDDSVRLENVTGPLAVRAVYGYVEVVFRSPVKGPVSISALHASIDVSIPVDTKAGIRLTNLHSPIMVSPDLKIELAKRTEELPNYTTIIEGKLNGGGTDFWLTAKFGKIYLRKTK
ncbi:MAG: hypothetical protein J7621_19595 [Niastella sp.]|nr:hypothetical protein [Niastella sp.]